MAERLRTAFELFEAGVEMKRQSLRRRFPDASDEEISAKIGEWLRERPGAEYGDAVGRGRRMDGET
ncbi:MAG: hypothetical protein RL885_21535 [Planctomycetota bacterium]